MFDKFKDMYSAQKQARQINKELKNTHIEAEVDGVIVILDGQQEVVTLTFPESETDLKKLAHATAKAFNKAIKKSQQIAAERMKPLMGSLKMPG